MVGKGHIAQLVITGDNRSVLVYPQFFTAPIAACLKRRFGLLERAGIAFGTGAIAMGNFEGIESSRAGVFGRVSSTWCRLPSFLAGSGDQFNTPVGIEEDLGGGPAVDDAHDAPACSMDEPSRGMEDPPPQRLGPGVAPCAV